MIRPCPRTPPHILATRRAAISTMKTSRLTARRQSRFPAVMAIRRLQPEKHHRRRTRRDRRRCCLDLGRSRSRLLWLLPSTHRPWLECMARGREGRRLSPMTHRFSVIGDCLGRVDEAWGFTLIHAIHSHLPHLLILLGHATPYTAHDTRAGIVYQGIALCGCCHAAFLCSFLATTANDATIDSTLASTTTERLDNWETS